MRFQTGKRAGKTLEEVLLKEPDFAQWYMGNHPETAAAKEFRRLMRLLDAKSFTEDCHSCGEPATRVSTYRGSPTLMFICDRCAPHSSGAESAKVGSAKTIGEVLRHIDGTADGHRAWKKQIVRELAEGKGLPKRVGEKQALAFFT
jgi:hypothetical protein